MWITASVPRDAQTIWSDMVGKIDDLGPNLIPFLASSSTLFSGRPSVLFICARIWPQSLHGTPPPLWSH